MGLPALTWSKGFSGPQNEEKAQKTALRVQNLHSLEAVSALFWATVRSYSAHNLPAGDPWQIPGDPSLDERDSGFVILYNSPPHTSPDSLPSTHILPTCSRCRGDKDAGSIMSDSS